MRGGCSPRTISSQRQNRPAYNRYLGVVAPWPLVRINVGFKVLYGNEATKFRGEKQNSPLSEIARVLVWLNHFVIAVWRTKAAESVA